MNGTFIVRALLVAAGITLCSCVSNLSGQLTAPAKQRMVSDTDGRLYPVRRDADGTLYASLPMVHERGTGNGWFIDIDEKAHTWEREGEAQTRWVRFRQEDKFSAEVLAEEPPVPLQEAGRMKVYRYDIRTKPTTDDSVWWRYPLAGLTGVAADAPLTVVYTAGATLAMPFYLITAIITGYRG